MKTLPELKVEVIEWANSKGILEKATPLTQAAKTVEEVGELVKALDLRGNQLTLDYDEIKDGIGDVVVTLIIQCEMQKLDLNSYMTSPLPENSHPRWLDQSVDMFLAAIQENKAVEYWTKELVHILRFTAQQYGVTIEECVQYVLHENDDPLVGRTGKMVDGTFVKDKKI